MAYLNVNSLRNEGFSHLESIWGQGIPTFAEYSMGSAFNMESIFNRKITNWYLVSLYCLER